MLLIVVLEGREKTMCDLRFWLLRGLGVEAPATSRAVHFCGALLLGIVGLNDVFFRHMSASVVYSVIHGNMVFHGQYGILVAACG